MRYKNEELVDEYLLEALESIQGNKTLQSIVNRMLTIDELYTHMANVAKLSVQLSIEMGMDDKTVKTICMAGVLHDTGKILTPRNILFKPGKLNNIEFSVIKRHPQDGYNLCKSAGVDDDVLDIILHHHEKSDGSGYPDGITQITPECAILTVADIFSALVEPRLYHRERTMDDAYNLITTFEGIDGKFVSHLKTAITTWEIEEQAKRT